MSYLYIMAGAMAGAPARYAVGRLLTDLFGVRFPYGTLAANLSGCLLVGVLATLAVEREALSREARLLLITGFLGSYTTFSAFGLETYDLLRNGELPKAIVNAVTSVVVGVIAVWAGTAIARGW